MTDESWDNKGPTYAGKRDAVRRYRKALLHTGMMNELFVDQIAKGEVSEEYVIEAFENFRRAQNPPSFAYEKEYVLGFMFDPTLRKVLLVWKDRPTWQKGRLNGIGGHIEAGETPHEAMVREFEEETFFKSHIYLPTDEVLVPQWEYVGLQHNSPDSDREPGSYAMHLFACVFKTSWCDFENQACEQSMDHAALWAVPPDYGQVKREEIINLPLNREIIRRRGVPDLNLHIDLALNALHTGRFFTLEEPDQLGRRV